jgi:DNA-binding NtrC family response regulator
LVPPLRERSRDIPELFVRMMEEMMDGGERTVPAPSSALMEVLRGYSWPGNLRELRNTVRSYLLAPDADGLMAEIRSRSAAQMTIRSDETQLALKEQVRRASRRLEAEIILRSLERYRWNRRRTARSLKISYRSLLYKMKECNIRGDAAESDAAGGEPLSKVQSARVTR